MCNIQALSELIFRTCVKRCISFPSYQNCLSPLFKGGKAIFRGIPKGYSYLWLRAREAEPPDKPLEFAYLSSSERYFSTMNFGRCFDSR